MKLFHSCHIHTPTPVVKSLACILLELFLCSLSGVTPLGAAANALSTPPGKYARKSETQRN